MFAAEILYLYDEYFPIENVKLTEERFAKSYENCRNKKKETKQSLYLKLLKRMSSTEIVRNYGVN